MKILNSCPFNLKDDKIRVLWEITPRCNMNCKHCLFFQSNDKSIKEEMNTKECFKIIENLSKEEKLDSIWLSGGEPLLRNDIVSICKKISEYGIKPSISTNGILLTKTLIDDLYQSGVRYIYLSIDGANAKTHDKLRGVNGAFKKLMEVMDLLKNSRIETGASFMVTEDSIGEMEEVIKIAKEKKLSVISFYLVAQLGRGADNFKKESNNLIENLQNKIKEIKKDNNHEIRIEVFRADKWEDEEKSMLQECKGEQFFNIMYNGELGACPWLMKSEEKFSVGSILEEDFIKLEKKCKIKMEQKKLERNKKLTYCRNCTEKNDCGKGCMALQINKNMLYSGLDPICPVLQKENQKCLI